MAEDGSKMSKSVGNAIDAIDPVDKYGSDALRMGIIAGRVPGVNRPYDHRRVEEARNFANKLWNIARFIESKVDTEYAERLKAAPQTPADHWILNKLSIAEKTISKSLDKYSLAEAYETLYEFVWHDFADWYVEAAKTENNLGMLAYVLENTLKLVHPFAPFVTETIWQTLAWEDGTFVATSEWPEKIIKFDPVEAKKFDDVITIVTEARNLIRVLNLRRPQLYYQYSEAVVEQLGLIIQMARLGGVSEAQNDRLHALKLVKSAHPFWLEVDEQIARSYLDKLIKQHLVQLNGIQHLENRLQNSSYVQKAPKEVVEQTKQKLAEEKRLLDSLEDELASFKAASESLGTS